MRRREPHDGRIDSPVVIGGRGLKPQWIGAIHGLHQDSPVVIGGRGLKRYHIFHPHQRGEIRPS